MKLKHLPAEHLFVLVPDREIGRQVRAFMVKKGGKIFAQVGTFDELVGLALEKRLLDLENDYSDDAWGRLLGERANRVNAEEFWKGSFRLDPQGVSNALGETLSRFGFAQVDLSEEDMGEFAGDASSKDRLIELSQLQSLAMAERGLPNSIQKIHDLLTSQDAPVKSIRVLEINAFSESRPLARSLIEKLNADPSTDSDSSQLIAEYQATLDEFGTTSHGIVRAQAESNLDHLAVSLFIKQAEKSSWSKDDASVQWLRCRDTNESIELTLSQVQSRLAADESLSLDDFGILVPEGFTQWALLHQLTSKFGCPTANLQYELRERNLAGELFTFALMAFEGLNPKLAIKSLVTNPLMPWSVEVGQSLAHTLDQHGFSLKPPREMDKEQRDLTGLLNKGVARGELPAALQTLIDLLDTSSLNEEQLQNLHSVKHNVLSMANNLALDYKAIREGVSQSPVSRQVKIGPFNEGVRVFYEGKYPAYAVKHLYVLDFVTDTFPSITRNPPVFADSQWNKLAKQIPSLETADKQRENLKQLFKYQLACASDSLTFWVPAYAGDGTVLRPSGTLVDCALVTGDLEEPESLIKDVRDKLSAEGSRLFPSRLVELSKPTRANIESEYLQFKSDLLNRWTKAKEDKSTGESKTVVKPQSPSALDNLLICPLGWLLSQLGAESRVWEPDGFTPLTKGLIAHDVMEQVFPVGLSQMPSAEEITQQCQEYFGDAIKSKAPFLNTPIWVVERQNLLALISKAAIEWAYLLNTIGASVVAPELWLEGTFDGHSIHGQTDSVISIPDRGLMIVDFKTSKATKYEKRMQGQWDLQASLYEEMLRTGGPKKEEDKELLTNLTAQNLSGVVYFTLMDQLATSNTHVSPSSAQWNAVGERDYAGGKANVSEQGLSLLKQRFDELREGKIQITSHSEIEAYEKLGFGTFVFESSPLIKTHIRQDIETSETEDDE